MKRLASFFLLLFSLSIVNESIGQNEPVAWQNKVHERVFEELFDDDQAPVIVVMEEQADLSMAYAISSKDQKGAFVYEKLRETADKTQAKLRNWFESKNISHRPFWIINAIFVVANSDQIEYIAQQSSVASIEYNIPLGFHKPVRTQNNLPREPNTVEWGVAKINADDVWAMGYDGTGVVVGGQDTGYDWDHEALIDKYRGWNGSTADHNYNWHDAIHTILGGNTGDNPCGLDSDEPCDDHYHGTHTMGTIVGSNGGLEIGVAPGAQWIGCRNMERGDGTPETYLECFEWFLAPTDLNDQNADPSKAPHVINNSWACIASEGCDSGYDFSTMETAIENLEAAGVVVVVSAGNNGPNCGTVSDPPAIYDASFSVGATNSSDGIASFSSRGATSGYGGPILKPNVSAPGVGVYSAEPDDQYGTHSGTSMAGPHVAGAVALLIEADPGLAGDVAAIKNILEQTAYPLTTTQNCGGVDGDEIPNNTYGYGRIDALAAVNYALGNVALSVLEFNGSANEQTIELNWSLEITDSDHRVILEKSNDQSKWIDIYTQNKHSQNEYTFEDIQPFPGINYYRLKLENNDGKVSYSKILNIPFSLAMVTDLYPNPVSGKRIYIGIEPQPTGTIDIEIYHMDGRLIVSRRQKAPTNKSPIELDVSRLEQGIYFLSVYSRDGKVPVRTRFIKQ